jgi:hypothetical protein
MTRALMQEYVIRFLSSLAKIIPKEWIAVGKLCSRFPGTQANQENTPKRSFDAITYPLICDRKKFLFDSSAGRVSRKSKTQSLKVNIMYMPSVARALSIFPAVRAKSIFGRAGSGGGAAPVLIVDSEHEWK